MKLIEQVKKTILNKLFFSSAISTVYSVIGILFSIITLSILVNYLGDTKYGIWITIYSISAWISFLDGGFGNGLRNELAKDLAKDDFISAKKNITTAYISISFFLLGILLIYIPLHFLVDWNELFVEGNVNYTLFVLFIFSFFILQMIVKLISKVLFAFNKASFSFLIPTVCNFLILASIATVNYLGVENDLWAIGMVYSLIPILIFLGFTVWFFGFVKPEFTPKLKHFDKKYINKLLSKGGKFFLIQINVAFIQAVIPFLITTWFAPEFTTNYHISLRYYSLIVVLLNIVLQNLWTPITKTYVAENIQKLNKFVKIKVVITLIFIFGLFIMWLLSHFVYRIWIGEDVEIPNYINNLTALYVLSLVLSRPIGNYLSAINKLNILVLLSTLTIITFLPLSYVCVKIYGMGIKTLILIPSIIMTTHLLFTFYQLFFIIKKLNRATENAEN
ncbi:hypothetical protein [uncultured Kordia sp.]|uniref:lipopolysaccharide biosynthesis protein n=1 Tax=uncultured Kordia sp. TaxID=507699 RepID=UPI0026245AC6|nr:hypothetical protein [uncultured Kordia sp.]